MKDVCFRCNDSMCPEVTTFYDFNGDLQKNLLMVPAPFQKCISFTYNSPGKCTMCHLHNYYYGWCKMVSANFLPALEANSTAITNYELTNCTVIGIAPTTVNGSEFTGAGDQLGNHGDELWWLLLPVLFVCIITCCWCIKKHNRNRNHYI